MKTTIQSVTQSFLAANKEKVKPRTFAQFKAAIEPICESKVLFSFNDVLAAGTPNKELLELFLEWTRAMKKEKFVTKCTGQWNFPLFRVKRK